MALTISSRSTPQVLLPKPQPAPPAPVQKTVVTAPPRVVVDTVKISLPAQTQQLSNQAHGTSDVSLPQQNASNIGSALSSTGANNF